MRFAPLAAAAAMSLALVAPAAPAIATAADSGSVTAVAMAEKSDKGKKKGKSKFALNGTVVSVAGAQLTFTVKGGNPKAVRGTNLTVTVAGDATITRDGKTATLSAVTAGDRVNVKGKRAGSAFTATKVQATD
ncbi:MAG: hypothetical protein ACT4P1_12285 [Sporichthyaceae bacterium]